MYKKKKSTSTTAIILDVEKGKKRYKMYKNKIHPNSKIYQNKYILWYYWV
jgi:hypothetical protein